VPSQQRAFTACTKAERRFTAADPFDREGLTLLQMRPSLEVAPTTLLALCPHLHPKTTCWSSGDAGCRAWSIDVQKSAIGTLPIYSPMRLRALVPTVPRVILPFRRGQLQVGFRRAPGRSYARCALIKLSAVSDGRRGNRRRRRRILIGRHLIGWTAARGR